MALLHDKPEWVELIDKGDFEDSIIFCSRCKQARSITPDCRDFDKINKIYDLHRECKEEGT